jgi:hypothetical protein
MVVEGGVIMVTITTVVWSMNKSCHTTSPEGILQGEIDNGGG